MAKMSVEITDYNMKNLLSRKKLVGSTLKSIINEVLCDSIDESGKKTNGCTKNN